MEGDKARPTRRSVELQDEVAVGVSKQAGDLAFLNNSCNGDDVCCHLSYWKGADPFSKAKLNSGIFFLKKTMSDVLKMTININNL